MTTGVKVGDSTRFAKTVGESDVYLFAGITGDFAANHVNEQAMAETVFGRRFAHGALLLGYMSTCSSAMAHKAAANGGSGVPVSAAGPPVGRPAPPLGDTITIDYVITEIDSERRRATADVKVVNQKGEIVAVATHLLQWVGE